MLPDLLIPYKHYAEEIISGVIDGVVEADDEDSENFPSEMTMTRWNHWYVVNRLKMEGYVKSIDYQRLGLDKELIKPDCSLLENMRSSIPDMWLKIILQCIYNFGNSL